MLEIRIGLSRIKKEILSSIRLIFYNKLELVREKDKKIKALEEIEKAAYL